MPVVRHHLVTERGGAWVEQARSSAGRRGYTDHALA